MIIDIRVWDWGLILGYRLGLTLDTEIGALDQGLGLEIGMRNLGLGTRIWDWDQGSRKGLKIGMGD